MVTRYTVKKLEMDCIGLNASLDKFGAKYRLVVGQSYNRTQIDLATPEQMKRHCCYAQLVSGTPRECRDAAALYVLRAFAEYEDRTAVAR